MDGESQQDFYDFREYMRLSIGADSDSVLPEYPALKLEMKTEADFRAAAEPRKALNAYRCDQQDAIDQLYRDLCGGVGYAIAKDVVRSSSGGKDQKGVFAAIPPRFWRDLDELPSGQDPFWKTGYIETEIPRRFADGGLEMREKVSFFNVRFILDSDAALPPNAEMATGESDLASYLLESEKRRRAQIERDAVSFSLDDFEQTDQATYDSFITPKEALNRFSYGHELAVQQMQRELQFNRVQAACDEGAIFYNGQSYRVTLAILHAWHWWQQMPRLTDDFWETGYLEIMIPEKVGGYSFKACGSIRYFGVRFDPTRLPTTTVVSDAPATMPVAVQNANRGGRPSKPWWDELWAYISAQLYNGGLKPTKLADIEKAMLAWVSDKGETVGETPIRQRARLVWDEINKED